MEESAALREVWRAFLHGDGVVLDLRTFTPSALTRLNDDAWRQLSGSVASLRLPDGMAIVEVQRCLREVGGLLELHACALRANGAEHVEPNASRTLRRLHTDSPSLVRPTRACAVLAPAPDAPVAARPRQVPAPPPGAPSERWTRRLVEACDAFRHRDREDRLSRGNSNLIRSVLRETPTAARTPREDHAIRMATSLLPRWPLSTHMRPAEARLMREALQAASACRTPPKVHPPLDPPQVIADPLDAFLSRLIRQIGELEQEASDGGGSLPSRSTARPVLALSGLKSRVHLVMAELAREPGCRGRLLSFIDPDPAPCIDASTAQLDRLVMALRLPQVTDPAQGARLGLDLVMREAAELWCASRWPHDEEAIERALGLCWWIGRHLDQVLGPSPCPATRPHHVTVAGARDLTPDQQHDSLDGELRRTAWDLICREAMGGYPGLQVLMSEGEEAGTDLREALDRSKPLRKRAARLQADYERDAEKAWRAHPDDPAADAPAAFRKQFDMQRARMALLLGALAPLTRRTANQEVPSAVINARTRP